jgi:ribosomal-protein-alanine N-acetyltransferase
MPEGAPILRRMTPLDLDPVLVIERTFSAPWSREMFLQELRQEEGTSANLLAECAGQVVGYVLWWFVADEVHIVNLAVDVGWRRRGIARRMLNEVFRRARARGMRIATLEVRIQNRAAIRLYESIGFKQVAIRKAYYADNGEDALVMLRELEGLVEPHPAAQAAPEAGLTDRPAET